YRIADAVRIGRRADSRQSGGINSADAGAPVGIAPGIASTSARPRSHLPTRLRRSNPAVPAFVLCAVRHTTPGTSRSFLPSSISHPRTMIDARMVAGHDRGDASRRRDGHHDPIRVVRTVRRVGRLADAAPEGRRAWQTLRTY